MTVTKTYCDHCNCVLNYMTDYVEVEIEAVHKCRCVDLCANCFEMLWDTIDGFCNRKGGAE